jgi:hypothetical protein
MNFRARRATIGPAYFYYERRISCRRHDLIKYRVVIRADLSITDTFDDRA